MVGRHSDKKGEDRGRMKLGVGGEDRVRGEDRCTRGG